MSSLAERLQLAGRAAALKVWGKLLTVGSGGTITGELEEVEPIGLETDLGQDPREGCWFHFQRPCPDFAVGEAFTDEDENVWRILQAREDNPYKPTVKYKVEKVID